MMNTKMSNSMCPMPPRRPKPEPRIPFPKGSYTVTQDNRDRWETIIYDIRLGGWDQHCPPKLQVERYEPTRQQREALTP